MILLVCWVFVFFFPITTLSFLPLSWELVKIKNYITGNVISPFSVWEKLGKIVVENKPKANESVD